MAINEVALDSFDSFFHNRPQTISEVARLCDPGYTQYPHIKYLEERLEAAVRKVEGGENHMMVISMPPRAGKSYILGNAFPLWCFTRHPNWKFIYASYSSIVAHESTQDILKNIESVGDRLGLSLYKKNKSKTSWKLDTPHKSQGTVFVSGVNGSLTGRGANIAILDDLHKGFADASSSTQRNAVDDWFKSVAATRLESPSLLIVVGTRWHQDDILGRLITRTDDFEHIVIPAIAEKDDVIGRKPGEPLRTYWSGAKPKKHWDEKRKLVGEYSWNALYQQNPHSEGSQIFKNEWWRYYKSSAEPSSSMPFVEGLYNQFKDRPKFFDYVVTSWDTSFKGTSTSDWNVGQCWGILDNDYYLLAQIRRKAPFNEMVKIIPEFIDRCEKFLDAHIDQHFIEDKANGSAIIDTLKDTIDGITPVTPRDSKEVRARSITPMIENGRVYLPSDDNHMIFSDDQHEFLSEFIEESTAFPTSTHDDQIDALTQVLIHFKPSEQWSVPNPSDYDKIFNKGQNDSKNKYFTTVFGKFDTSIPRPSQSF